MKNIYFISDAHLSFKDNPFEIEKRKNLTNFLEFLLKNGETMALYLLGDMFDFWFEWYHVIPKYWFSILYQLKQLKDSGITIYFLPGNHDFYLGEYLEKEIGLKCQRDHYQFEYANKKFFVTHGDGYAKKDKAYRLMKRVIRHPISIFLFKTLISPDFGMQLARCVSKTSRKLENDDKSALAEEYFQFAQEKFACGFDYVITGHLHYPTLKKDERSGKFFVNCGDWISQFTYAKFNGQDLSLEQWKD